MIKTKWTYLDVVFFFEFREIPEFCYQFFVSYFNSLTVFATTDCDIISRVYKAYFCKTVSRRKTKQAKKEETVNNQSVVL